MKTILICHGDARLNRQGFSRWLASFTELVGIVEIHEQGSRTKQRILAEIKRVGLLRFIFDVLPYRLYNRMFIAAKDGEWERRKLNELCKQYPEVPSTTEVLVTQSPNSEEARAFIKKLAPDMTIARCKTLIREDIFSIPDKGTFILHPGICPEYRNSHGCFWALANNEPDKVGMTLLKINAGVDTGPIYGYYSYAYDVRSETMSNIHHQVVYKNLSALEKKFEEIYRDVAEPIEVDGRTSNVWGQPWLSRYFRIRRQAQKL